MKKIIIISAIAILGYLAFLQLSPHNETWLHGKWLFAGGKFDYMTFYPDGTVEMSNDKRIYARCVYASVVDNEVDIECKVRGKVHELKFEASNNGTTLTNNQAGSIYNKVDS